MKKDKGGIRFYNRLSFKVGLITVLIVLFGIGATLYFYVQAQNSAIINSRLTAIREESEILHVSIKNNMLAGEAPIAVQLFKELSSSAFISNVQLYRADGTLAFSDNDTLFHVNEVLGKERFLPKSIFQIGDPAMGGSFEESAQMIKDVSVIDLKGKNKFVTIYTPLINQPKCAGCHGLDHVVRGVIAISSPLNDTYETTMRNTVASSAVGLGVIALLSLLITLFLNKTVISQVLQIGHVAARVGEGDFKQRLNIKTKDEIGKLAGQINDMVDGLNERFKLSKFVSRSTLEHVKGDGEISLGGERKEVTVLFSDIRGFTSYSESRDPEEIMNVLNTVMNLQANIINSHGGDIDKYVGDEIMAVFEGPDMSIQAAKAAVEIRDSLMKKQKEGELEISVGIGINHGLVVMGNMGSEERIDRTVIGDTVNLGARLCSLAGKNTIVISEFFFSHIGGGLLVKEHDPIKVKGKSQAVKIYTLRGVE